MLAGVVQIKMHLPGVGMSESPKLKINHHQAAKPPVKEEQVYAIPLVVDAQAALAAYERESLPSSYSPRAIGLIEVDLELSSS